MRVLIGFSLAVAALLSALVAGPLAAQATDETPAKAPVAGVNASPAVPLSAPVAIDRADLEAWLDGYMMNALDRGRIAGGVVVVVDRNGPILEKGYGFSDLETRSPVTADGTLFRPGSVSKLFTWTAVMQLVEEGKLDLDEDVNSYLDFTIPPFDGQPITLRNIMTHTPGFEESLRYLIGTDPDGMIPLDELMPKALPERVFAPGTTPAYSNYATALAGDIVQRVSGMAFDDYIEARVLNPLGMAHSSFRQPLPDRLALMMSRGYPNVSGKAQPYEMVFPAPAGSLAATGSDMGRFMIAHLNDGGVLLKPETARIMHDYRAPGIGPLNRMALGFYEQHANGHRAIGHGGNTQWFHSYLWLFEDDGIGLFVSINSGGVSGSNGALTHGLFHKFADRYLPGKDMADTRVDDAQARRHAAQLAGHYVSSRGSFTNFMSIAGLLGQTEIVATADGSIALPALENGGSVSRKWVEIEPFVWQDLNSGEKLAAELQDGKVLRVSIDTASPFTVLVPASAGVNAAWLLPALLADIALVAIAAIGWPVRALVRRRFKGEFPFTGKEAVGYRLSRILAWIALLAVGGWLLLLQSIDNDWSNASGPMDWLIQLLRVVTPLACIGLIAASGWHFWLCLAGKRGWGAKLGALLLLLAALVLGWVALRFNLYGLSMVY